MNPYDRTTMTGKGALLRSCLTLFPALLIAHSAPAAQLVPEKSEIRFVAKQMNVPVDGVFKKFKADINFNGGAPETGKAQLTADVASFDMGLPDVEAEVKRPAWFDSAKFPAATFVSNGVKALGGNKYEVAGKLTIKGISRDITVPFTLTPQSGGNGLAEGAFTIKRLDYRIGEGTWSDTDTVANEVQVRFKLQLTGLATK
jgi:polyisoprenoid-binding protein YceI